MKNSEKQNIIESVNFISEEDLMVQELDKRLSFDMVALSVCVKACDEYWCKSLNPDTSCGIRG